MKLTFLGTGGDLSLVAKGIRNPASIMIEYQELQFHLDPAPSTLAMARAAGINLRATTAIICTSSKLLKINDLAVAITAMTSDGSDIKGVVIAPREVIDGPLLLPYKHMVERILIAESEKRLGIENVDFLFYDCEGELGVKMLFSDITISSVPFVSVSHAKNYDGSDILIVSHLHPEAEDLVKFVGKIAPKLVILTGLGKAMVDEDPLLFARKIHSMTGCQVMAATDGQEISPVSYAAKSKQKTLKGF